MIRKMIRLAVSSKIFHNETIKNERMDESTSIAMKIQTIYAMKILGYATSSRTDVYSSDLLDSAVAK